MTTPRDDPAFEALLTRSLHASVDVLAPPPGLVEGGRERALSRRRRSRLSAGAAAAAAVLVAGGLAVALPSRDDSPPPVAGDGCRSVVDTGVVPEWARTGFSDPEPSVPHVLGDQGRIVAILFGRTLHSPPSDDVSNKVLWVSAPSDLPRDPDASNDLVIDATLEGTDARTVRRVVVGGPGPSTLDLPGAGCWHLELTWGSRPVDHDTLDLEYVAP